MKPYGANKIKRRCLYRKKINKNMFFECEAIPESRKTIKQNTTNHANTEYNTEIHNPPPLE